MEREDTDVSSFEDFSTDGFVDHVFVGISQTLEVGSTKPLKDRLSRLPLPTTAPPVVEESGSAFLRLVCRHKFLLKPVPTFVNQTFTPRAYIRCRPKLFPEY